MIHPWNSMLLDDERCRDDRAGGRRAVTKRRDDLGPCAQQNRGSKHLVGLARPSASWMRVAEASKAPRGPWS